MIAGRRPLAGRRVLVTRATEQAGELVRRLESEGASVVHVPAIRFETPADWDSLDRVIEAPSNWDWIVFTSVNGVDFFARRARETGRDPSAAGVARIAAVGDATRDALRALGIEVDITPSRFRAADLIPLLPDNQTGVRTAVVRALEGREEIVDALRARGGTVHVAVAYETRGLAALPDEIRADLVNGAIDVLTFTSPSAAGNVLRHLSTEELERVNARSRFVSIGPTTTTCLNDLGAANVREAATASVDGLVRAVISSIA
jgi:uroporphyrinogen III methyltransferase / synthase